MVESDHREEAYNELKNGLNSLECENKMVRNLSSILYTKILEETPLDIRTMSIADYEEVYALWRRTPGMGLNTLDDSREGIERYLARNPGTCFVADEGGHVVGVILSGHDGRRGFIHHTAVAVEERRRGIGRALVDAALKALKKEGIHKVALVVFEKNELGNAFWEKLGFERRQDLVYRNKVITEKEMVRIDT